MTELDIKRKASELLQKGRYADAIAEYETLVGQAKRPNPAILNLIGDIYIKQGNFEKGFESYLMASRVYAEEGLFHNGIAVGKKVLRLDKDQVDVYGMLGNLYARQGLGMDSVKFLSEYARRKEEANEYPAALASFAEACENLPEFPDVHVVYGQMLERVDRTEDAAACYRAGAQAHSDRGYEEQAAQLNHKADLLLGRSADSPMPVMFDLSSEDPTEADEEENVGASELMNLRTLDDTPAPAKDLSNSSTWVRPEPLGLDDSSSSVRQDLDLQDSEGAPWRAYDPAQNPDIPPPPPLPGSPATPEGGAEADSDNSSELVLDSISAFSSQDGDSENGLELTLDISDPFEDDGSLDDLPGIIMPPSAPSDADEIALEAPDEVVIESGSAARPDSGLEAAPQLEEFFDAPENDGTQQAVVIGDDFELVREGGDVSEVIADFRDAVMDILDLDDFQAHYDLGTTYMEMELFDEAAAEYEIAARGEDFALPSREMLGYCFLRKGQIDLAITELKRGLAVPGYEERDKLGLFYNLGIACGVLDKEEEAIQNFQTILEIDPNFRDTRSRLERLVQNSA